MKIIVPQPINPTTFTRSTTATYVGSDGLIKNAAINEPRPDYVDGVFRGLLIEEQRTNLLLRSGDLTTSWTASSATVAANSTIDPAGTTTADTLTGTGVGGRLTQNVTAPTTGSYSASVYVRAGTVSTFELLLRNNNTATNIAQATFNLTNGTVSATTAGTAAITNVGGGWYRVSVTSSGGVTAADLLITYLYAGNSSSASGSSVVLYGAQLEAGAFATSYIPTVASTVTRAADVQTGYGLTYSNVPETDATAWTAGTYTLGNQVLYNHRIWEVIVSSTSDQPDIGAAANPPTWLDIGADNRYKMFDNIISTQTENSGTIEVAITPGAIVNAVAMFGLSANEVTVVVDDPTDGIVYNQTRQLQDNTLVTDWYAYFFEPIVARSDIIFDDLPSYGTAEIQVTIDAGGGTAKCSEFVMGQQRTLGVSNFGTSVSIVDYSIKSTDAFGNVVIVPRAFSKRAEYDVTVETAQVSSIQKSLADIRTTPTVFIGDPNRPETVVYGYYKQFQIVLSTPSISSCSLEVEGLV